MTSPRLTVRIPDHTRQQLANEAHRLGLSLAGTVNVIITQQLQSKEDHDRQR